MMSWVMNTWNSRIQTVDCNTFSINDPHSYQRYLNSSERKWFTVCIPKFYIWTCKWCHGRRCPGIEAFSHFLSCFNAGTSLEKKKNTLTLTTCISGGPLEKFAIKGCVLLGRILGSRELSPINEHWRSEKWSLVMTTHAPLKKTNKQTNKQAP